jgi:N-methylhydantoinase B
MGNTDLLNLEPSDILRISCCGAGGYGDPTERNANDVLKDVQLRLVSVEGAYDDYGVAIKDGVVDHGRTERRRSEMARSRRNEHFDVGPMRRQFEKNWTLKDYDALTSILAGLPSNWRFFVKRKIFDRAAEQVTAGASRKSVEHLFEGVVREFPQITSQVY